MITLLTSELNRINQEINKRMERHRKQANKLGIKFFDDSRWNDTIELQREKETLKKVSLMWADGMLRIFQGLFCSRCNENCEVGMLFKEIKYREEELKQIKSLMEKA
jgi:hypothetical protein